MALYIPHSIFHLARLLYVGPETFGPHYVRYLSSYDGCFQCELRLKLQFFFSGFPNHPSVCYSSCRRWLKVDRSVCLASEVLYFLISNVFMLCDMSDLLIATTLRERTC